MPVQEDFLKSLELLGVTARLKRLSDALTANIKELYREQGADIEPSWHAVLLYLRERTATQSEIANALRLSQPAMTKMIQRMTAKGYLEVLDDDEDGRKNIVRLTRLARRRLPALEKIWQAGRRAVAEILRGNMDFLRHLEAIETKFNRADFLQRASKHL